MTIAFRNQRIVAALAAFVSLSAAAENCIELTTTAEAEQTYTNEQGQQAKRQHANRSERQHHDVLRCGQARP